MKSFEERMKDVLDQIYYDIREFDPDVTDTFGVVDTIIQLFKRELPEYHLEKEIESTIEEKNNDR